MLRSASAGWVVGSYLVKDPGDGKSLFRYIGGKWTPYPLGTLLGQLSRG